MARGDAVGGLKEEFKVLKITTLGLAEDKTAKEMLEKTAWQVQPIMTKRQWKVGLLTEMPINVRDRAGDNYNRGQKVRIKLRRLDGSFEEYEHVLMVMLHELCHNEFGPHSASFYKLLDEIQAECEELMAKGVGGTGSGFDAPGLRLGHRGGWGVTHKDALAAAAAAAEKRAQFQSVMGGGGKTGGAGSWKNLPPAEAARRAAERREAAERFSKQNGLEDDAHSGSDDGDADAPSGDANARRQTGAAAGPSQQQEQRPPPRGAAAAAAAARAGDGGAAVAGLGAGAGALGPPGCGGGLGFGGGLRTGPLLSLRGGKACVCGSCGPAKPTCEEEDDEIIVLDGADAAPPPPDRGGRGEGKGAAAAAAAAAAPAAAADAKEKGKAPGAAEPEVIDLISSDDEEGPPTRRAGGERPGGAAKRKQQPAPDWGGGGEPGKRGREERGAGAGAGGADFGPGFWTCRVCTLAENRSADANCRTCGEWRYSTAQLGPAKSRFTS